MNFTPSHHQKLLLILHQLVFSGGCLLTCHKCTIWRFLREQTTPTVKWDKRRDVNDLGGKSRVRGVPFLLSRCVFLFFLFLHLFIKKTLNDVMLSLFTATPHEGKKFGKGSGLNKLFIIAYCDFFFLFFLFLSSTRRKCSIP